LELGALGKYLNPSKKKLASKGVDSVVSRVMNLREAIPDVTHESWNAALERAFNTKWEGIPSNKVVLKESDLRQVPELMRIYEKSAEWDWRFGVTPNFSNSIEHKFDWALVDIQFDVEKGKIVKG